MKRIVAVLLALIMLTSSMIFAYAEAAVQFEVGSVSVDIGARTATVPISLTANSGHNCADITVVSDLTIIEIEDIKVNTLYNLEKGLINWSYSTDRFTVGEILRVTFALPESIQPGDSWVVDLSVTMVAAANMGVLSSSVISGLITVKGLTDLSLTTMPTKTTYTVGEIVDITGLALTAT